MKSNGTDSNGDEPVRRWLAEIERAQVGDETRHLARPVLLLNAGYVGDSAAAEHVANDCNAGCVGLVNLIGREDDHAILLAGVDVVSRLAKEIIDPGKRTGASQ